MFDYFKNLLPFLYFALTRKKKENSPFPRSQNQEEELTTTNAELKKLRMYNHDLSLQKHDYEKQINSLNISITRLEQEVKLKLEIIDKTVQQKEDVVEQKRYIDAMVDDCKLDNKKLREKLKTLGDEVLKANEIIKKQHTQIRELKYKNDFKNKLTLNQEKVIKEKTELAANSSGKIEELTKNLSEKSKLCEEMKTNVVTMEEKIKNQDNCIQWLNKQLNDKNITQGAYGASMISKPGMASARSNTNQNNITGLNTTTASNIAPPVSGFSGLGAGRPDLNLASMRRSLDTITQTNHQAINSNSTSKPPIFSSTPLARNPKLAENTQNSPVLTKLSQPTSNQNKIQNTSIDPKYFSPSVTKKILGNGTDRSNTSELANDYLKDMM